MTKTVFMEKYPVHSLKLRKDEISHKSVDEIIKYFAQMIEQHPIATNIAVFNHFKHTKNIGGEIEESILDAKNIIFCFGGAIPNSTILAVRPRSIGIVEFKDSFCIEFMQAPNPKLHKTMLEWVMKLK